MFIAEPDATVNAAQPACVQSYALCNLLFSYNSHFVIVTSWLHDRRLQWEVLAAKAILSAVLNTVSLFFCILTYQATRRQNNAQVGTTTPAATSVGSPGRFIGICATTTSHLTHAPEVLDGEVGSRMSAYASGVSVNAVSALTLTVASPCALGIRFVASQRTKNAHRVTST
jgi:hypothetical protein